MNFRLNCLGVLWLSILGFTGQPSDKEPSKKNGRPARSLLSPFAAFLCALALWSGLPTSAQAQYPCGNGPGPGEVVVGQTPGGAGHAPILLCQYVGGDEGMDGGSKSTSQTPKKPGTPMQPSYMAAAQHVDTGSLWVSVGHRTLDSAQQRVLKACNAATRGGCYVSDTHFGVGELHVAEDAMGQLWTKIQPYDKAAPRFSVVDWNAAIEHCWKNSFGCRYAASFQSGLLPVNDNPDKEYYEDRFPKGTMRLKRWALVARPTQSDTTAGPNKSWLVSGKEDSVAARKEVLNRCQTESGAPCAIAAFAVNTDDMVAFSGGPTSVNGLLVHFVDARGRNRWTSAVPDSAEYQKRKNRKKAYISPMTVRQRIDQLCPPQLPCRVVATYDAATPRLQIIEDSK